MNIICSEKNCSLCSAEQNIFCFQINKTMDILSMPTCNQTIRSSIGEFILDNSLSELMPKEIAELINHPSNLQKRKDYDI